MPIAFRPDSAQLPNKHSRTAVCVDKDVRHPNSAGSGDSKIPPPEVRHVNRRGASGGEPCDVGHLVLPAAALGVS